MTQRILIRHRGGKRANQLDQFLVGTFQEILVGRDDAAAVRFDPEQDDLVSRIHLRILPDATSPSGYSVTDLQSRNGTYLNGHRLFAPTPITHNDILQLGPGGPEISFELDPPPPVAVKPTREAGDILLNHGIRATREANIDSSAPFFSEAPLDPPRPVGRFTVERMLGESFQKVKLESNKALWVGVASILIVFASAAALFLYLRHSSEENIRRAVEQQVLLQKLDDQAKATPAQEAQMKQQIAQLADQLKAAREENRREFLQLARSENRQPDTTGQPDPKPQPYDTQLQTAVQQFANNDLAGTMNTCAALIRLDGSRWEAYALAGRALSGANKPDQAKGFFLKAQQLAPDDTKPIIQPMIDKLGQESAALAKEGPVSPQTSAATAYDQLVKNALDLLKANQPQPAMQAAAQLISQYPNRWESYGVAGTVLRSQSKLPEAKQAYQRAMELAPNDVKPQLASVIRQIDSQTSPNKTASR